MPRAFRYINEFLMGFCTLLMLAVAIAATVIVVNRQATVTAPGISDSTVAMLLKATGKSLRYRDTFAYYASKSKAPPRSGDGAPPQAGPGGLNRAGLAPSAQPVPRTPPRATVRGAGEALHHRSSTRGRTR